jgi:hypothetical protein
LKLELLIISRQAEMQIDLMDEQFQKALFTIRGIVEPASNRTVSDLPCETIGGDSTEIG